MLRTDHILKDSAFAVVMGLLVFSMFPLRAADNPLHQVVDDLEIYVAVLPAEMVRGHPRNHSESQMHGGVPSATHYHIMVALFDSKTGVRLRDATITATVKGVAAPLRKKVLEPMLVAGVLTYGNYFRMAGYTGQNRIILEIKREGTSKLIQATFEWTRS